MACISDTFTSEHSSQRVRSLDSSNLAVGRTKKVSPFLDAVIPDELHTHNIVAADELCQFIKEWFSLMLSVELLTVAQTHSSHSYIRDDEPISLNNRDNLADVLVAVRLDHGESLLFLDLKPLSRENVSVVYNLELSAEDGQY